MKRILVLASVVVLSLWIGGCSSKGGATDEASTAGVEDPSGADATALPGDSDFGGAPGGAGPRAEPGSPLAQRVIYFEFDQSTVKSEYLPVVEAHAGYLRENPNVTLTLEGHADERGTREYNIALGDRRANAVSQMMLFQGVAARQVQVVSFGEERPAVFGQDEASWGLNRRVVLVYAGES